MFSRALSANLGKVLGTLLVIGIAGSTVSYGTFATFTAQTSNTNNTFSTGTLALNNVQSDGTTCFSTTGGGVSTNNNPNCGSVIVAGGSTGLAPGGAVQTGQVGIYNNGTLSASSLKLWADACSFGPNTAISDPAQRGPGDPCPYVNISVTDGTTCWYGTNPGCIPTSTTTLATGFAGSGSPLQVAAPLAAGTGVTYTFAISLDQSAPNSVQGTVASTTFHWQATQ